MHARSVRAAFIVLLPPASVSHPVWLRCHAMHTPRAWIQIRREDFGCGSDRIALKSVGDLVLGIPSVRVGGLGS